jgi:hypothetical protein
VNFYHDLAYDFNNQKKVRERNEKCEPRKKSKNKMLSHLDPPDGYLGLVVELYNWPLNIMFRKCRAIRVDEKIILLKFILTD